MVRYYFINGLIGENLILNDELQTVKVENTCTT